MHLPNITTASLDDAVEAVDLGQPPGDVVVMSFADSDLSGLAAAWAQQDEPEARGRPSLRLVHLRDLRHPMSVDLWIERVAVRARVIVVRLIGGLEWWRYGVEQLAMAARAHDVRLAVLPGEDRDDPRLAEASTLEASELAALLRFFRAGGPDNLRALLRRLGRHARGEDLPHDEPRAWPRSACYLPGAGALDLETLAGRLPPDRPVVAIVFYRAALLAGDTMAIDALAAALSERGLAPALLAVTSLKDAEACAFVTTALARLRPATIVTTTAFAAGHGTGTVLDGPGVPVLQAVIATTRRDAWRTGARGLGAADLAMHVVLPELDGRVLMGAIAFKDALPPDPELAFTALVNRPETDRVAVVADRVAALVRLQAAPRASRRVAVLMPDYPGAGGRSGYAVGLDVPASVIALLDDLAAAGFGVADAPQTSRALMDGLRGAAAALPVADYLRLLDGLPAGVAAGVHAAWGNPGGDPDVVAGAFRFRVLACGNAVVALPPDRGRALSRRADYHDPALPPRHALMAFGLWLRHVFAADALVHMGAHGTLEWLPGKAVALTAACFPEVVAGALPVFYPFLVSNPGEAAQAKRRLCAVTIGHLPAPLADGGLSGDARRLERLLDEYAEASGLDRRRCARLADLIVAAARDTGIGGDAGIATDAPPDDVLRGVDAWLCDLKDLAVKDGLHVYGRAPAGASEAVATSAAAESAALITALDGRRVAPGPAGAPLRGRRDVLPTGRNMFVADPRMLPTPTAVELGRRGGEEVVRLYLQTHGEMPRALVIDLWGSATLRTGGEEIAQGLSLMGCRPVWDPATGRVTGVEVLPTALAGRPRIDVTWRISGLFRDLFPAQIALIDAAVRAVAARAEETGDDNPLAQAWRHGPQARIFGTAPGAYRAGIEDLVGAAGTDPAEDTPRTEASGTEASGTEAPGRDALGAAYLAAASHVYGGPEGEAVARPGSFTERVARADLIVHPSDDAGRDLLEGGEDLAFVGGFAAAAARFGRAPDLVILDTTDPARPRARPLAAALARIVRGRAVNERFIAGQMRHGPRGAAELAETVDRLIAFAQTTDAVAGHLIDLVYDAYVADADVRAFLVRENPAAARAIAARLAFARGAGLWHPRRNDVEDGLTALTADGAS